MLVENSQKNVEGCTKCPRGPRVWDTCTRLTTLLLAANRKAS